MSKKRTDAATSFTDFSGCLQSVNDLWELQLWKEKRLLQEIQEKGRSL